MQRSRTAGRKLRRHSKNSQRHASEVRIESRRHNQRGKVADGTKKGELMKKEHVGCCGLG
jgi:hypothetical protein